MDKRNMMFVNLYPTGHYFMPGVPVVEIARARSPHWKIHRLTDASWRRLMYVADKYGWGDGRRMFVTPDSSRINGQDKTPSLAWRLYMVIEA